MGSINFINLRRRVGKIKVAKSRIEGYIEYLMLLDVLKIIDKRTLENGDVVLTAYSSYFEELEDSEPIPYYEAWILRETPYDPAEINIFRVE